MRARINGQDVSFDSEMTIGELIKQRKIRPETVVVEYNGVILAPDQWETVALKENDSLEILSYMGGGGDMEDPLMIAGRTFQSRFFLGTGKFSSYALMRDALRASRAPLVTVALRRVDTQSPQDNVLEYIPKECLIMTNTSGARNAEEAIRIARVARAAGCGDWIKIEVIPDQTYLLPDNAQTIRATEVLAKEGFVVMPYMNPDLADARRLQEAGAASIMPLGAPIGTNKGVCTRELIKVLVREISLPVVVDAGIGRPSHAAEAMELGASAVLVNTAVATAQDPVAMARAFSLAVEAGRLAYRAGVAVARDNAEASSPLTGFLR